MVRLCPLEGTQHWHAPERGLPGEKLDSIAREQPERGLPSQSSFSFSVYIRTHLLAQTAILSLTDSHTQSHASIPSAYSTLLHTSKHYPSQRPITLHRYYHIPQIHQQPCATTGSVESAAASAAVPWPVPLAAARGSRSCPRTSLSPGRLLSTGAKTKRSLSAAHRRLLRTYLPLHTHTQHSTA
jgi:hypothetical protein